jgi:hypothetical protein
MLRRASIVLFLALAAWAANVRLYLKDGGYHLVREYQVQPDRVRFYSVERSEWEEIPLDLVDLKRTEAESAARNAQLEKEAKAISEEAKAQSDLENEIRKIPQEPGVYWVDGGQTKTLKQAEATVHTGKGRSVLRHLNPMSTAGSSGTLEMNGAGSETVFTNPGQEFYFQLAQAEDFGIAKLTVKGTVRIVEEITFPATPQAGDPEETPTLVPILQREAAEGLYKIWPQAPLAPGEYAVIEYTPGKLNMQIWDFAVKPKEKNP